MRFFASTLKRTWEPKEPKTKRELPPELKERTGLLMLKRAHDTGLTEDDLKRMTFDEYFAWLELSDWMISAPEEEAEISASQASHNAFFHL